MVAVVFMPRPWATRMTSSQVSVGILCGLMAVRTRSTRTSAPPPGRLSRPAAWSRVSVSSTLRSLCLAMWTISGGDSEWMWIGYLALMPLKTSSNQQMSRSGWRPPCIMIAVPPSSSVSSILRWMSSSARR